MAETAKVGRNGCAGLTIVATIVAPIVAMIVATLVAAVSLLPFLERPARAADQPGAECLACHGDKTMTTTRAGRTVSLYVDGKKFSASVHASFGCTGCHMMNHSMPISAPPQTNCGGKWAKSADRLNGATASARPAAPA